MKGRSAWLQLPLPASSRGIVLGGSMLWGRVLEDGLGGAYDKYLLVGGLRGTFYLTQIEAQIANCYRNCVTVGRIVTLGLFGRPD